MSALGGVCSQGEGGVIPWGGGCLIPWGATWPRGDAWSHGDPPGRPLLRAVRILLLSFFYFLTIAIKINGNASLELHQSNLLNHSIRLFALTEFVKSRTQSNYLMCRVVCSLKRPFLFLRFRSIPWQKKIEIIKELEDDRVVRLVPTITQPPNPHPQP